MQVGEWFPKLGRDSAGVWITLEAAKSLAQYVDPTIAEGLTWWKGMFGQVLVRDMPVARGKHGRVQLSISDAWTALSLSRVMARVPGPIVVLQADDHRDLGSPMVRVDARGYTDLISGKAVEVDQPRTVENAILSGAIGMGGWLTLAARESRVSIHRLRSPRDSGGDSRHNLKPQTRTDTFLGPDVPRAGINVTSGKRSLRHLETAEPGSWVAHLPSDAQLFVHIDADYFCNRFNWNSAWREEPTTNDHDRDSVEASLDRVLDALESMGRTVAGVHIAMSPGFFPGEYWPIFNELRLDRFNSLIAQPRPAPPTTAGPRRGGPIGPEVTLEPYRSQALSWIVRANGTRAGTVKITRAEGGEWSIYIKINQDRRGQGIGSAGYRLAVEASGLPVVWAHIRKSNPSSVRAAEKAGFTVVPRPGDRQLALRWARPQAKS